MAPSTVNPKGAQDGRKSLGNQGEDLAIDYLQQSGYLIRERNFRTRHGEIDIVAEDQGDLVFVEVRTRSKTSTGHPLESVNWRKQRQVAAMARFYLQARRVPSHQPCRFDVVAIVKNGEAWDIELVKNAFSV